MTCAYDGCTNAARYIDDGGRLCCGICPLKAGRDSVKLASVPRLLAWARWYLSIPYQPHADDIEMAGQVADELRAIVCKDASRP